MPDGRATQPERYSLRPHRSNCVTFQRKIYVTERLSDVINFIDDLLTLTTMVEEKQPPVPDPELPATPSTPLNSDTEGNRREFWAFVGRRTRRGITALRNSAGESKVCLRSPCRRKCTSENCLRKVGS